MAAPKEGIASTIAFSTANIFGVGITALLRSISWNGAYGRETLDTSYMATTTARTFIGEALYNAGELELTYLYGGDVSFALLVSQASVAAASQETVTINLGADGAKTVKGILTGVSFGAAVGELMEFTITIKGSGEIG